MSKEKTKEELKEKELIRDEIDSINEETTEEKNNKSDEAADEDKDIDASEGDEKYIRLFADFQNYKKRAEAAKTEIYAYANESLCSSLLPILDNFERALSQDVADELKSYHDGIELIFKQFFEALEKAGLSEIEAEGKDFDPNFHNAVMVEDIEDMDSGKVTVVLQKGYTLNGKVIRPSMVKVSK